MSEYYNDNYCGTCHTFTTRTYNPLRIWCSCLTMALRDFSKDPNCKNPRHEHHDPKSPIVLSQKAVDDAELKREEEGMGIVYLDIDEADEDAAAKSLSPEQVEERRKNLAFIRENIMDMEADVFGDHLFTTTLIMQEEWLATVDEALRLAERWKRERDLATEWMPALLDEGNKKMMARAVLRDLFVRVREGEEALAEDRAKLEKYEGWLHQFVDHEDQPCTLDHHGYCQEHPAAGETCVVAEVRDAILEGGSE